MNEFLSTLLQTVIIAAVPVCATFIGKVLFALAQYIAKKAEIEVGWKYAADVTKAISTAVTYVSQTYVDGLKKSDKFTKENQEEALAMALDQATHLLTAEARDFLKKAYGDLDVYLVSLIEAEVRKQKIEAPAPTVEVAEARDPIDTSALAATTAAATAAAAAAVVQTSIVQAATPFNATSDTSVGSGNHQNEADK